jgi:hypothetical protein
MQGLDHGFRGEGGDRSYWEGVHTSTSQNSELMSSSAVGFLLPLTTGRVVFSDVRRFFGTGAFSSMSTFVRVLPEAFATTLSAPATTTEAKERSGGGGLVGAPRARRRILLAFVTGVDPPPVLPKYDQHRARAGLEMRAFLDEEKTRGFISAPKHSGDRATRWRQRVGWDARWPSSPSLRLVGIGTDQDGPCGARLSVNGVHTARFGPALCRDSLKKLLPSRTFRRIQTFEFCFLVTAGRSGPPTTFPEATFPLFPFGQKRRKNKGWQACGSETRHPDLSVTTFVKKRRGKKHRFKKSPLAASSSSPFKPQQCAQRQPRIFGLVTPHRA